MKDQFWIFQEEKNFFLRSFQRNDVHVLFLLYFHYLKSYQSFVWVISDLELNLTLYYKDKRRIKTTITFFLLHSLIFLIN